MDNSPVARGLKRNDELTAREREVIVLSAEGKSIEEIGMLLQLSAARVREHSRAATSKLGAKTYTHAVVTAIREFELLDEITVPGQQMPAPELSNRELQVLSLSARGYSMEEIALTLAVSIARVREHSRAATLKLGARTYTQAVVAAMHEQLITTLGMKADQNQRSAP